MNLSFTPYSQETMQSAFSANESRTTLHRHMITVEDAEYADEEEKCGFNDSDIANGLMY